MAITSASRTQVVLPNLVSMCNFDLRFNRHGQLATKESLAWLIRCGKLKNADRQKFDGLKVGLLASNGYPDAGYPQLLVTTDFLNWLFHIDDLTDDMDTLGTRSVAEVIIEILEHPDVSPMTSSSRLEILTRR